MPRLVFPQYTTGRSFADTVSRAQETRRSRRLQAMQRELDAREQAQDEARLLSQAQRAQNDTLKLPFEQAKLQAETAKLQAETNPLARASQQEVLSNALAVIAANPQRTPQVIAILEQNGIPVPPELYRDVDAASLARDVRIERMAKAARLEQAAPFVEHEREASALLGPSGELREQAANAAGEVASRRMGPQPVADTQAQLAEASRLQRGIAGAEQDIGGMIQQDRAMASRAGVTSAADYDKQQNDVAKMDKLLGEIDAAKSNQTRLRLLVKKWGRSGVIPKNMEGWVPSPTELDELKAHLTTQRDTIAVRPEAKSDYGKLWVDITAQNPNMSVEERLAMMGRMSPMSQIGKEVRDRSSLAQDEVGNASELAQFDEALAQRNKGRAMGSGNVINPPAGENQALGRGARDKASERLFGALEIRTTLKDLARTAKPEYFDTINNWLNSKIATGEKLNLWEGGAELGEAAAFHALMGRLNTQYVTQSTGLSYTDKQLQQLVTQYVNGQLSYSQFNGVLRELLTQSNPRTIAMNARILHEGIPVTIEGLNSLTGEDLGPVLQQYGFAPQASLMDEYRGLQNSQAELKMQRERLKNEKRVELEAKGRKVSDAELNNWVDNFAMKDDIADFRRRMELYLKRQNPEAKKAK